MRSSIPNRQGHTKINEKVKKALYNFIPQYPQVVQYPIANDCLKVHIDGQSETQVVPNLLLQVSVIVIHNRRGPAQDIPFDLTRYYVSKHIYFS